MNCTRCGKVFRAWPWWRCAWARFRGRAREAELGGSPLRGRISIFVLGHECVYSYWRCKFCGFYTLQAYSDRWDDTDPVTHLGPFPAEVGERCEELLAACPRPMDEECDCDSHKALYYGTPHGVDAERSQGAS